jgi:LPS-assembly lipoprotein
MRLSFILLLALLAGCGFHLRGMNNVPPWLNQVAVIVQEGHQDLGHWLKEQLEAYKISVPTDSALANYWLIIEKDGYRQEITNVSSSTAPRQYLLIYDVQFSITNRKGRLIIPSSHVIITRQVTINNDRILGSDAEETLLKNEMRQEAAMQIINRLSQIKNSRPDSRQ